MKLHIVLSLAAIILFSTDSYSKSIETYIDRSDGVYVISVESAKSHSFVGEGIYWTCGIVYEALIYDVLKGDKDVRKVIFAAETRMKISSQYLVSLRNTIDDFEPTGNIIGRSEKDEKKYQECLDGLPLLKEDWFFTSKFEGGFEWLRSGFMTPESENVKSVVYEVMKVKVNGEEGSPYRVKNKDALPFEVTVPNIMLNWESYKSYLSSVISKNKTNKPQNIDAAQKSGTN